MQGARSAGGAGVSFQPANDVRDELAARSADADRLLLAVMQMSLSLIGFGFTIHQIFSDAATRMGIARSSVLGRQVGIALLGLGMVLLAGGLWARVSTMREIGARRARMAVGLAQSQQSWVGPSPVLVVGGLLFVVALVTLVTIVVHLSV